VQECKINIFLILIYLSNYENDYDLIALKVSSLIKLLKPSILIFPIRDSQIVLLL